MLGAYTPLIARALLLPLGSAFIEVPPKKTERLTIGFSRALVVYGS